MRNQSVAWCMQLPKRQMEAIRINLTSHLITQPVDESCGRSRALRSSHHLLRGSKKSLKREMMTRSPETSPLRVELLWAESRRPHFVKLLKWDLANCRVSILGILHALISRTASTLPARSGVRKPFEVAAKSRHFLTFTQRASYSSALTTELTHLPPGIPDEMPLSSKNHQATQFGMGLTSRSSTSLKDGVPKLINYASG